MNIFGKRKSAPFLNYIIVCVSLLWLHTANASSPDDGALTQDSTSFQLVKKKHVAPVYPTRAVDDGREGWVDLAVTVSPDGSVSKVAVLAAKPRRIFERPAIRAVRKWKFEPPSDAGMNQAVTKTFRVSFRLVD